MKCHQRQSRIQFIIIIHRQIKPPGESNFAKTCCSLEYIWIPAFSISCFTFLSPSGRHGDAGLASPEWIVQNYLTSHVFWSLVACSPTLPESNSSALPKQTNLSLKFRVSTLRIADPPAPFVFPSQWIWHLTVEGRASAHTWISTHSVWLT